ncbi:hypothetical protein F5B18DRAFT_626509 [Nemania serpens]|nr:hypothetical protein F5B18DRAFT_626509 [Nemania serpens]
MRVRVCMCVCMYVRARALALCESVISHSRQDFFRGHDIGPFFFYGSSQRTPTYIIYITLPTPSIAPETIRSTYMYIPDGVTSHPMPFATSPRRSSVFFGLLDTCSI